MVEYDRVNDPETPDIDEEERRDQLVAMTLKYRQAGYSDDEIRSKLMTPSVDAQADEVSDVLTDADEQSLDDIDL